MANILKAAWNVAKGAVETAARVVNTGLTELGFKEKAAGKVSIKADGTVNHNIDLKHVPKEKRAEVKAMIENFGHAFQSLDAQIREAKESGDTELVVRLERARSDLSEKLTEFKYQAEHPDISWGTLISFALAPGAWGAVGADLWGGDEVNMDVMRDLGTDLGHTPISGPNSSNKGAVESSGSAGRSESSGKTDSSDKSDKAESDAYKRYKEMDPDQVASMMHRDREAFWADMGSMSLDERNDVMTRLQMHLQQANQMFTMFSQLSQAMHDTAKGMINNMRV